MLDRHLPFLEARWSEGCTNATQLWRELKRDHMFVGSRGLVGRWAFEQRKLLPASQRYARQQATGTKPIIKRHVAPPPLSAPQASWLFVSQYEQLDEDEQLTIGNLTESNELLANAYVIVQTFMTMVRTRGYKELADWIDQASKSGLSQLAGFAASVKQDFAEVYNALRLEFSNGPTEGHVNRLKFIKRQMYGRANFDLLRKRVLFRPNRC